MRTIHYAAHTAYLHDMTGYGMLVLPMPGGDLGWTGETSLGLHEADWNAVTEHLRTEGWEFVADEWGLPETAGVDRQGRTVLALYGLHPVIDQPSIERLTEADAELVEAVGLVRE